MSTKMIYGASLAALLAAAGPAFAEDDAPALQDVVVVTGHSNSTETETQMTPDYLPLEGPDITHLLARTPGGARIGNGALSGQVQYRGLFGERLNLRVDGQRFASGGPGLMDPVFHYAPAPLIAQVVIDRGVSPVSAGPGLAGGSDAVFKRVDFSDSSEAALGYDLSFSTRSVDSSYAGGGVIGLSTDSWRVNVIGSTEQGEDFDFADGTVGGSEYQRDVYGLSAGYRTGAHTFSFDMRRQNTGKSGNPPFPMDIQFFDTDFARAGYEGDFDRFDVKASLNYIDVAHLMDNYSLRQDPPPDRQRYTYAYATTLGGDLSVSFAHFGGVMEVGLDGETVEHDVTIYNPNNANFFVTPAPDIEESRIGVFAEWTGFTRGVNAQFGLRVDDYSTEAGTAVTGPALPMAPQMLASMFNMADPGADETTVDAVARFWTEEINGFTWRGTIARKNQVPNYVQRYGWLPLTASGGLADGNIYVGDLELDPETAWIFEAGFDYFGQSFYARPTIFLRDVEDYIQGVPYDDTVGVADSMVEMVAGMSGDPTPLRFANTDARLYGLDLDFGYDFDGPWRVDGVFSYVRGERTDIDDNLYRVAPPNLTLAATYEQADWSASFEVRGVAEQSDVSVTNSEQETGAYAIANLYGDWTIRDGVHLSFGIENLFDEVYRDHLSGYNRNAESDVALGERVPGAGRSAFVRIGIVG